MLDDSCPSSTISGHAVALVGYRTLGSAGRLERQFLVKNSWGRDWAHDGYAWMPESMLVRQLTRAFRLRLEPTAGGPGEAIPAVLDRGPCRSREGRALPGRCATR